MSTTEQTRKNQVNPLWFFSRASSRTLVPLPLFPSVRSQLRLPLFPRSSAQVRFYLVLLFSNSKLNNHLLGLSLSRSERSSEQPTRTAAHSKVNYRPVGSLEPNSLFTWIGFAEYLLPPTIRTSIDPPKGPPGKVPREQHASKSLKFHYQGWVWCTTAWLKLVEMPVPHGPSSRL